MIQKDGIHMESSCTSNSLYASARFVLYLQGTWKVAIAMLISAVREGHSTTLTSLLIHLKSEHTVTTLHLSKGYYKPCATIVPGLD
jgi:hypothetical protein